MPYQFLKGFNPWDIIIRNIESNKVFSLSNKYKVLCSICYYPIKTKSKKKCHKGIKPYLNKISFITGHFYKVDYRSNPTNWFSKLLKDISCYPFKYSHELLRIIIEEKIRNSNWRIEDINISTMVPTNNLQMESLFSEISQNLGIDWISHKKLFIRKKLMNHYDDRTEYVKNKYSLTNNAKNVLEEKEKVLIFDDIFNQGYTFGRIIELLLNLGFKKYYLVTIGRTVQKSFAKTFSFP